MRIATSLLTVLILAVFAFLAVRGILSPQPASGRFGVSAVSTDGVFFFRVYLARNLVVTAAAAVFLILRLWKPLAILMSAATALPLFDIALLLFELGPRVPWPFHLASACIIALLAALLWIRVRLER